MPRVWIFFCVAAAALAQSGGVTGTVLDLGGDPVSSVVVEATNVDTKAMYRATASAAGSYAFAQLPAGRYELSVDALGFTRFVERGVTVSAAKTVHLDIHLLDYQLNTLGDGRDFRIGLLTPHPTPSGPTPRTTDGKPDLSGVWYPQRTVDGGKPEMVPWAAAILAERTANNSKDAPGSRCLPRGLTNGGTLFPYQLVQTSALLVMIFEDDNPSHRLVYLDGRAHPKDLNPTWLGHSIGHWDKDTLVIDTVGFNDRSWIDIGGHPHTEGMHITERLHRADLGHLETEITIEDPGAYSKPWVIRRVSDLAPGEEVQEFVCENEKDVPHLVGK
jgi:carboxypeptidase family protein